LTRKISRPSSKERLDGISAPAQFIIGTHCPRAPTGKILKHKLIETFKDQLALIAFWDTN